jgi:DNA gyrase subunit A
VNRTDKTGNVVTIMEVLPEDEMMIITKQGVVIRSSVAEIRNTGRNAQGVKLVNLDAKDLVTAVARVIPEDKNEADSGDLADEELPVGGGAEADE